MKKERSSEKKPLPSGVFIEDVDDGRILSEPDLNLKSSGKVEPGLMSSNKVSHSESSQSTIEYSAEYLDNQQLYDNMNNRMQGGEYKGILLRLGTRRFKTKEEEEWERNF